MKMKLLLSALLLAAGCHTVPTPEKPLVLKGTWCSLGTSITWYNNNVAKGRFTRGYQDRVMDCVKFDKFVNAGINGGVVRQQPGHVPFADYYTIEHGVNDWGHSTPVGKLSDYVENATNGTFSANYRVLVDKIRAVNPKAKIILATPRKSYGFGSYLPAHSYDAKNGIYLQQYANAVRAIAAYEKFPVADFFDKCGEEDELASLSIDKALHPNDPGYQRMADEVVKAFADL
ncbi:MAG: SGNH/GDSL hydrolase family protein [Kiritimatiellae bacterium]|nr:SGNH/GDSL hydrolase family protein [Kiritimatiellia bacterium]